MRKKKTPFENLTLALWRTANDAVDSGMDKREVYACISVFEQEVNLYLKIGFSEQMKQSMKMKGSRKNG